MYATADADPDGAYRGTTKLRVEGQQSAVLSELANFLRGVLRLRDSDPEPDDGPNYGRSVTYTPCRACGEGTLEYDDEADADVCSACGARFPRT